MPPPRFQQSQEPKSKNRGNRRKPRTEYANPAAVNGRPQIFGQQRRRTKRNQVQFQRQFEPLPGNAFAALRVEIERNAKNAEQECRPSEQQIALAVERQLIRSVVKVERTAIPIRGKE